MLEIRYSDVSIRIDVGVRDIDEYKVIGIFVVGLMSAFGIGDDW